MQTVSIHLPEWITSHLNSLEQANASVSNNATLSSSNVSEDIQNAGEASPQTRSYSLEEGRDGSGSSVLTITIDSKDQALFERLSNVDAVKNLSYEDICSLHDEVKSAAGTYVDSPLADFFEQLTSILEEMAGQKSNIEVLKNDIDSVKNSPLTDKVEKFDELKKEMPQLSQEGTESVKNGSPFYGEELQECMMDFGTSVANALLDAAMPDTDAKIKQTLSKIATLISLENGMSLKDAADLMAAAYKYMGKSITPEILDTYLTQAANAASLLELSNCVDVIFHAGYPHTTDIALVLKQALCATAEQKENIASLHALNIARDMIDRHYIAAKGPLRNPQARNFRLQPQNFSTTQKDGEKIVVIRKQSALITENAATKFAGITSSPTDESQKVVIDYKVENHEGIKSTSVPIKNFDFHLAHIALLEAEAIKKGLLDDEVFEFMLEDINDISKKSENEKADNPRYAALQKYLEYNENNHGRLSVDKLLRDNVTQEDLALLRQIYADKLITEWGTALNLQKYVGDVQSDISNLKEKLEAQLNEANKFFAKGVVNSSSYDKIQKNVNQGAAGIEDHFLETSSAEALYRCSPSYLCRQILNKQLLNISGVVDSEERYNEGQNEALKDAISWQAKQLLPTGNGTSLKDKIFLGEISDELAQAKDYKEKALNDLKGCRRIFMKNHALMTEIAQNSGQKILVKADIQKNKQFLKEQEAVWKSMEWVWPFSQSKQRAEMADLVLQLNQLEKDKELLTLSIETCKNELLALKDKHFESNDLAYDAVANKQAEYAQYMNVLNEIAGIEKNIVDKLKDIDPQSMISTSDAGKKAIQGDLRAADTDKALQEKINTIINTCTANAKAVIFFTSKEYKNIKNEIKRLEKEEVQYKKTEEKFIAGMKKMYGKKGMAFLNSAIHAAVSQLFLNSGEPFESYKVRKEAVVDQLEAWGITVRGGLVETFMDIALNAMMNNEGGLDKQKLLLLEKGIKQSEIAELGKFKYMVNNVNLDVPDSIAQINLQETALEMEKNVAHQKKILSETLGDLMNDVVDLGGFSYDFAQGFSTSKIPVSWFISGPLKPLLPGLEVDIRVLSTEGFHVRHTDDGAYEVLLTGGTATQISASLSKKSKVASGSLDLGKGTQSDVGVILRFSEKKDCLGFLQDIMNPAEKARGAKVQSWMNANEVRNVTYDSSSGFVSVSASVVVTPKIIPNSVFKLSPALGLDISNEDSRRVERNSHGTIITTSHSEKVTAKANLGVDVPLLHVGVLAKNKDIKLFTENFITCLTPNGKLRADTARELVIPKHGLALRDMLTQLGLDENQKAALFKDKDYYDKISQAWDEMGTEDTVTLKCRIKPEVLEKAAQISSKLRELHFQHAIHNSSGDIEAHNLYAEYNKLLSDPKSYEPEALIFKADNKTVSEDKMHAPSGMLYKGYKFVSNKINKPLPKVGQDHHSFNFLYYRERNLSTSTTTAILLPSSKQKELIPLEDAIYSSNAAFYIYEHIMRGTPEHEVKQAMEKAVRAKMINDEEAKLLEASLAKYQKELTNQFPAGGDLKV